MLKACNVFKRYNKKISLEQGTETSHPVESAQLRRNKKISPEQGTETMHEVALMYLVLPIKT